MTMMIGQSLSPIRYSNTEDIHLWTCERKPFFAINVSFFSER